MRNSAQPRPLYSVIGPATISVSASGESNGGSSSLPIRPTSATTKPIGCVSDDPPVPARRSCSTSPICQRAGDDGRAEQGEQERRLVREELRQRARGADQREPVDRVRPGQPHAQRHQAQQVERDDQVAAEAVGRRAGRPSARRARRSARPTSATTGSPWKSTGLTPSGTISSLASSLTTSATGWNQRGPDAVLELRDELAVGPFVDRAERTAGTARRGRGAGRRVGGSWMFIGSTRFRIGAAAPTSTSPRRRGGGW